MAKKKEQRPEAVSTCFEESLSELEQIVAELESGKLPLSDALARYEQGVRHLKACQQLLERAERRIELLSGVDADGNPITQPLDDAEFASLEAKADARGARRTSGSKSARRAARPEDDMDDVATLF